MKKILSISIIIILIMSSFVISANSQSENEYHKIIIRIYYENDNVFIPKNCDIISGFPGNFIDVLIDTWN